MTKRIAVIALISYMAFILEFLLYHFWGAWGSPSLLMLVVIFFNLYLGIRYSITAALFCGFFKDVSGVAPFGTYILIYVMAAYLTTLARQYVYEPGSRFSRVVVTFLVVAGCFILQAFLSNMSHDIVWRDLFLHVLLPQLTITMVVATYVFIQLRNISNFFALK
ncbi:MAG: rod shape-determining protein MreD [Candidatus Omnitrophica bacterium]|nr:rod shape-determining protein MreD [Candidatus Omnitrophota bacterium]